ncbi:MAG: MCP four helix bundle domain-containing protein [Nitrosomonas sp.]|nr:MCP four helix bundle domain-containing protein [Nitrosomonas sp.]
MERINQRFPKTIKRAEEIWARFMVTELTTVEEQLAQEKLRLHAAYVAAVNKIFAMTIAGDFDGASKNLKDEAEPLFYRLHDTIYSMITLQGKVAAEKYESAVSDYSSIFMIMIVTISSSVLLACILGYILLRGIVKPLNEAITIANAVAAGDLSTRIEPRSTVNGYLAA